MTLNDTEQLNSLDCQDILSINKLPLHDRFEHKENSCNLSVKSKKNNLNREIKSVSSDVCTLTSISKEKLDKNSTSNIDSEEDINISEKILSDETDIIQTTYSRDFPSKQSSTLIALRPRSTRHAFRAPTCKSISTPNTCRNSNNLEVLNSVDGPYQSTYSRDYVGCWTPQPDSPIRTATSSGTRANRPHPRKDFLTYRNEMNQMLYFDKPSSPVSTVSESPIQRDKTFCPHRHSEADVIQSLVYNRPKVFQRLTREQYSFLNQMRFKSTYQDSFNVVSHCNQPRNIVQDSIKSVHEIYEGVTSHPLSLSHLNFTKPSWKYQDNTTSKNADGEFINGSLKLTVPCTRYGSNKNHHKITRGINYVRKL
ncbi:unnamed protein product [Schistosoma margrebowiei]|uniref:Uncharacterized protein n=1 Tax=Schistosoma margrebowiei TaxID=48269 RepID=A0AA85AKS9_9TREM|nr:unnamed protein product [Schistosoma margrebowiei]